MDIANRRFLITGASLVGSHIAQHLLQAGAREVVLFDNLSLINTGVLRELLSDKRVRLFQGDIRNVHALLEAMVGIDAVFATAAFITNPMHRDPLTGLQVNVVGHQMTLEACRWSGVKKIIYSSSVGLYGVPQSEEIDETHPLNFAGLPPASVLYGASKVMAEQLCRMYQDRYGVDFVALRYSTVYGERQSTRGINSLIILDAYDRIRQGLRPQIPGDGTEAHDYLHASDAAHANILAVQSDVKGECITVATGVETSYNDLYATLLRHCGSQLKPEHVGAPQRVHGVTTPHLRFSRAKAERLLGWQPTITIEEGVRRLIDWHEQEIAARA